MSNKFWTSEKLLSLSAIFISMLTLFVFAYQTSLIRKQQKMSVYPYLSTSNEYGGTIKFSYVLTNEGIGPAIIESVKITAPDGTVFDDFIHYVDHSIGDKDTILYSYANLSKGMLIAPNTKINLIQFLNESMYEDLGFNNLELAKTNTLAKARKLKEILNLDELKFEITYASIYGDKWQLDNSNNIPQLIE